VGKLVLEFKTKQYGHRRYRLVRYLNGANRDVGYVIEEQREDALGALYWDRLETHEPHSAVATLIQAYVDKDAAP